MKACTTVFLTLAIALSASAQYRGQFAGHPGTTFAGGNNGLRNQYGAGTTAWGDDRVNAFSGSWEFPSGDNNRSDGGSVQFSRGGRSTENSSLFIHGNGSGYFAATANNGLVGASLAALNTSVFLDQGLTFSGSDRAIMLMDNNRNANAGMGNWTFVNGTFIGNQEAALAGNANLVLDGVSMYSGSGRAAVYLGAGSLTIRNTANQEDIVYQASDVSSGLGGSGLFSAATASITGNNASFISSSGQIGNNSATTENVRGQSANAYGVSGATILGGATVNGGSYSFIANNVAGRATAGGDSATANAFGGHGAWFGSGNGTISNSIFRGAAGGSAEILKVRYLTPSDTITNSASSGTAISHGGSGLASGGGALTLINAKATGGNGGFALVDNDDATGYADASGGNGVLTSGTLTINGGSYEGKLGGTAIAKSGQAYAFGGNGVWSSGNTTLTINDGIFQGGAAGKANGVTDLDGAGVKKTSGTLTINGGTFRGAGDLNLGVMVDNAVALNITQTATNTLIDGNLMINRTIPNQTANIQGGTIAGNIYITGSGTTALTIGTNAIYSGSLEQSGGIVNVTLVNSAQSKAYSNVRLLGTSIMNFGGQRAAFDNASFALEGTAELALNAGATLSNSTIKAGSGTITGGSNIVVGANSSIAFAYGLNGDYTLVANKLTMTGGNLVLTNATSKISATAIAANPSGSVRITTGGVNAGTNALSKIVAVDLGWLTRTTSVTNNGGIVANWAYNSVTNSSLGDIDPALLANVDAAFSTMSNASFLAVNSLGQSSGSEAIRYDLSQMPDVSESAFQVSQQIKDQFVARGTEFRSINGFASTKPTFGNGNKPSGVAGPEEGKDMQGWIRAYGSKGSKDEDGNFASYDSGTWGTVIGVDKSFGNLLIGLAGGFSRTDLDGGSAYSADVETYHGSVYTTIGGESIFLDLAATYGKSQTEESNPVISKSDDIDADIYSLYAGIGKKFGIGEKIAITPEASMLATFFEQQAFDRTGLGLSGSIDDYETESYLSSLGVNVATMNRIDWLNRGMALVPELRLHWLHEFNADPDDFTYTLDGGSYLLGVRPRDEDLLRLGLGFDLWNWRYQHTKFEVDYDGLFSDTYSEHILSGKITREF